MKYLKSSLFLKGNKTKKKKLKANNLYNFKFFFFFLITNTILTIQYETPLRLITMLIYITLLTVINNYTTYSH